MSGAAATTHRHPRSATTTSTTPTPRPPTPTCRRSCCPAPSAPPTASPWAGSILSGRDNVARTFLAGFQPHLYTRTRDFSDAFGLALGGADRVFVTDVYAAREEPIAGVSGRLVAESVPAPTSTRYVPDVADLGAALAAEAAPGDLVIVMGAGDVDRAGRDLLDLLEEGRSSGA